MFPSDISTAFFVFFAGLIIQTVIGIIARMRRRARIRISLWLCTKNLDCFILKSFYLHLEQLTSPSLYGSASSPCFAAKQVHTQQPGY